MPRYLDESDPFSARFDVVNHSSLFSMNDVQIVCDLNKVITERDIGFLSSVLSDPREFHYDSVSPGETVTIACPLRRVIQLHDKIKSADITLRVVYRWPFWPRTLEARQGESAVERPAI
jgi:hypothetical protein